MLLATKTILCVPDSHFPFVNRVALNQIYEIARSLRPNIIISLGDLLDFYSFSRFPKSVDFISPKEEVKRGRAMAEEMWRWLQRCSPKAKCFQLLGNHCERPIKQILSKFPEAESLFDFSDIYSFPEVETMESERDELVIDDIVFMHGFRSQLGQHCIHNQMNTVCGHTHKPGVFYTRLGNKTIWEMNCGHIALESSKPMSYTRQRQISKWCAAVGVIDSHGPRVISLPNK